MFNVDYITKEYIKAHIPNCPEIPGHSYRILIVAGSGSGKTKALLHLITNEQDIYKIYSYTKDSYKTNYRKRN